ncbi:MAG TPA: M15 family metallopeptidase [Actinomycetota bacterium]|nr:M15 family metallopeptidase [Actinomycetota bacterium]
MRHSAPSWRIPLLTVAVGALLAVCPPAHAYDWTRPLQQGDTGKDVKALQVRVAGWFPRSVQKKFPIDGVYSLRTANAVKALQSFFGLTADGIAGQETLDFLNTFEDPDGSTIHFDFKEFAQHENSQCSAQANAYSGTFNGGMVSKWTVKRNVKRLMWRLEAVRAKGGGKTIGINSGFRSVAYNDCIGGARSSQHMYGTAADNRMAETDNRLHRDLAKASQIHGIGCYASLSHNHFDLRIDNADLPGSQFWWWPDRDESGRDLDESSRPCWGEHDSSASGGGGTNSSFAPVGGSRIPSLFEVLRFAAAGEPSDLAGAD